MTPNLNQLQKRLAEAYGELWDNFVDPREPYGDDGEHWLPLGVGAADSLHCLGPMNEAQLAEIRRQCRALALENEFAINGHENRISYIVGAGHVYRATIRKCSPHAPREENITRSVMTTLAAEVQHVIDEFIRENCWHHRQQEIVRRRDRDGEAFLRFFTTPEGNLRVRFIEPDQIFTPARADASGRDARHVAASLRDAGASFGETRLRDARLGVLADRHDVETVIGYFVDGRLVDAAEIQHRKANVDANCRRGLPLFYPVRKNLRRAEKLLRNMSVVAEIQSAIALIRKHRHGTVGGVQQFVASQADTFSPGPQTGNAPRTFRRYGPGTILDAHAGVEYDFPAAGVEAQNFVTVLQAELRAVASRLVMPEFMLTSDASNANYSSTMVAEGPAMRMFARLQAEMVRDDLAVMRRVVEVAIAAGRLPIEARTLVESQAAPPSLAVRDQLEEAHRRRIEHAVGILSPQTWSQLSGLDYDQEQANFAAHGSRMNPGATGIEVER